MLCFSIGIISCSSEKKEAALQWKKSKVAQEFIVNASASSKYILLEDGANFLIGIESNSNNFSEGKECPTDVVFAKKDDTVEYAINEEGRYVFRPLIRKNVEQIN